MLEKEETKAPQFTVPEDKPQDNEKILQDLKSQRDKA